MKLIKFLLILWLIGCTSKKKDSQNETVVLKQMDSISIDSVTNKIKEKPIQKICECRDYKKLKDRFVGQVSFSKYDKDDKLFKYWSNDSLRKKLKSVNFKRFDTIPEKFKIFTSVERIVIYHSRNGIQGLDYFPKLKELKFWGSRIAFNPKQKWSKRITQLHAEKSYFSNLKSFKQLKNLHHLHLAYSSLSKETPTDIFEMKCIKSITLGAYMGKINLSKIDLSKNYCLEDFEFLAWAKLKGIPKGLDNHPSLKSISISHSGKTKEEKALLKKFKNR